MTTSISTDFEEFKTRREGWIEWLVGDDRHSIKNQITQMIWNAAGFRVINEARRLAPTDSEGGVQLNGMMHDLINRGFFVGQANAIRRLVDRSSETGDRGVYSLYGLLNDMEKNVHLMTREHIFAAEGLVYDYEPVRRAYGERHHQQERGDKRGHGVPGFADWYRPQERHEYLDRLSGVAKNQRSPQDSVRPDYFDQLKKKLDVCGAVRTYVNKFIAHAATPGSRAVVKADGLSITLGHLWDAHEAICKVANFVGQYLLTSARPGSLVIPQYNQFEYIDRPLIAQEDVGRLHEVWEEYDRETQEWAAWGLDEFEIENP